MSELEALIGVLGGIDEIVVESPDLASRVAPILTPYRHGATGWYSEFVGWATGLGTSPERFPDLDHALDALSDVIPAGWTAQRRLFAIAALSRVISESPFSSEVAALARRALAVPGLAGEGDASPTSKAAELLRLLGDESVLPDVDAWSSMLKVAVSRGLIEPATASQLVCDPGCCSQIIFIAGNDRPVLTVETECCAPVSRMRRPEAERFLEPGRWTCMPLWCEMAPLPPGPNGTMRFLEVISLACGDPGSLTLRTCLEFLERGLPDDKASQGRMLEYRRIDDDSCGDSQITIDEGSIEVREFGNRVCIRTTKRVQFRRLFDAGPLSMIVCALGYGQLGEQLVQDCAHVVPPPPPQLGANGAVIAKKAEKASRASNASKVSKGKKKDSSSTGRKR